MTGRERMLRTMEFRNPDRAPRNLWALPWVSQYAAQELATLLARFPSDVEGVGILGPSDYARGESCRKGTSIDEWNCPFEVAEDGVVGEVKHPPLADWKALDSYRLPWEMIERNTLDAANRQIDVARAGADPFMLCGTSIRPFERMQFLRGTENLYLDLGYESAEFFRLRDRLHEFWLKELEVVCRTRADAVSFMDDWGSQQSLLISPTQWRSVFKPLYAEYAAMIHRAGKKVMFHSDGCILDIYEDLIEIGIDAVNSQLFCMDIQEIARRFKGRITFWGEIDRQHVLPFGTPADVYRAVARVRTALDDGRGGVIAECEWGKNNPAANIHAVFEAWDLPLEELLEKTGA